MVKLVGVLSRLGPAKVLVVGDMMLDVYTFGNARRISPEAPVAIIHVKREEYRAGGAGNVILSLISLGATVSVIGLVGNDSAGDRLISSLCKEGVDTQAILRLDSYITPVKNRIISHSQQMVRVDYEQITVLTEKEENEIIQKFPILMEGIQVVALSDYGKGLLSRNILTALIACAQERNIPVIADPKGTDFSKYAGVTLIKPNLSEAYAAARLTDQATLEAVAKNIFDSTQIKHLMITRSEEGISLFHQEGGREDFPVHARNVKDVTGAGDTVLAMLSYSIANGLTYGEAIQLCNVAAGIAIEHVGCARVTLGDVAQRLLHFNHINKIFDEDHHFALDRILKERLTTTLHLSSKSSFNGEGLSYQIFKAIRHLAKNKDHDLLIVIDDAAADHPFVEMLALLEEVDYIYIKQAHVKQNFDSIEKYQLKEGNLETVH